MLKLPKTPLHVPAEADEYQLTLINEFMAKTDTNRSRSQIGIFKNASEYRHVDGSLRKS
jgi:hypothetical protein